MYYLNKSKSHSWFYITYLIRWRVTNGIHLILTLYSSFLSEELNSPSNDNGAGDANVKNVNDDSLETMRAEEYEHLAKLCLDRKQ